MSLTSRAVSTAVAAGLIGVAAWLGVVPLVLAGTVLVCLLAGGWAQVTGQPTRGGTPIVLAMAGLLALLAAWRTTAEPVLRFVSIVIAMAVGLAFLAEMMRQDGRSGLLNSLAATVTGAVIATGVAGWVAAARSPSGAAMVVAAALAIVFGSFVVALPISPGWLSAVITIWVASGIGMLAGHLVPHTNWDAGLTAGATAGITIAACRLLLSEDLRGRGAIPSIAASIVPVAVAGIATYALKWLLLG